MNNRLISITLAALIVTVSIFFNETITALAVDTVVKISAEKLQKKLDNKDDFILIDVREKDEFASGHVKGATNLPLSSLEITYSKLPKTKKVVLYCNSAIRSNKAAGILIKNGYSKIEEMEGFKFWTEKGLPYVKGE